MGNTLTDITPFGRDVAGQTGYPGVLGGIHHGLTALGRAVRWSALHRAARPRAGGRRCPQPTAVPELAVPDQPGASWSEYRAAGLPRRARDPGRAQRAGHRPERGGRGRRRRLGYPVVVKLAADGIEHKSDIGGVKVGPARRGRGAGGLRRRRQRPGGRPAPTCSGALVQPQRAGGIELLVGVVTDPAWGQVLAVGLGGVWVEILRDTAARGAARRPRRRSCRPLRSLRGARLFDGPRGTEKADLDAVADAIAAVGRRWPAGSATGSRRWRSTRCWSAAPRSRRSTRSSPGASPKR